ncbi:MAG: hypothetical protein K2O76_00220, partial [Mailhella sp.]|nr:hypothetical protein [Mailhella sp.]
KKLNKFLKKPIKGIYCNKEAFMEIDTASLGSVQGQMSLGIQKQSLDFDAQMTNKLMQDSLQAADNMRASQGIGTNLNITA